MESYKLLEKISQLNPSVTHFLLRLYKTNLNPFIDKKGDFSYEWISVENLDAIGEKILEYESKSFLVGLSSIVMTETGIQSLLFLDFCIDQSESIEKDLQRKINFLEKSNELKYSIKGWLIKTNESYHFLGMTITSPENFIHFLGVSLLFREKNQPVLVDDRWLGHSLKKRYATIRLGHKENQNYPCVISCIDQ